MKIYFAGSALAASFEETTHAREDIPVFSLAIEQREDEVAHALIKTKNDPETWALLHRYEKFFISWENQGRVELIFAGRLSGEDTVSEGNLCALKLRAASPHVEAEIKGFLETGKRDTTWDPLFIPPEKRGPSCEIQDTDLSGLYVDRKTWTLWRSSFFEGREMIFLGGRFIRESLKWETVRTPLRGVRMTLKAEWIQYHEGCVNVARAIERKFPGFKINSFTDVAIEAKWPKRGDRLGRSGYETVVSVLEKDFPSQHKLTYSPPLKTSGEGMRAYVKRHWYRAKLYLRWRYRQKRRETLSFTLEQEAPRAQGMKEITIPLQEINPAPEAYGWVPYAHYSQGMLISQGQETYEALENHKAGETFEGDNTLWRLKTITERTRENRAEETFFLTPRGQQAFEHGLTIARYHLVKSARTDEIKITGLWEDLVHVTTDHSLFLEDPRLPGGRATGKVVRYRIYAEGGGRRAVEITMSPIFGIDTPSGRILPERSAPLFAHADYCEEGYEQWMSAVRRSPSGIGYYDFSDQCPRQGLPHWRTLRDVRMVRHVRLKNGPLDQLQALLNREGDPQAILKERPTEVQVQLYDVRTRPCLEHRIEVEVGRV